MKLLQKLGRFLGAGTPDRRLGGRRALLKSLLAIGTLAAAPAKADLSAEKQEPLKPDQHDQPIDPVDLVDPNIGGIGHLLTSVAPEVQLPHGLAVIAPVVEKDVTDIYLATSMQGFSVGNSILMAATGRLSSTELPLVSDWDHDHDQVRPYYGCYQLETYGIRAEYTAMSQAVFFRFTFPPQTSRRLTVSPMESGSYTVLGPSSFSAEEEKDGVTSYLHIEINCPSEASQSPAAKASGSPGAVKETARLVLELADSVDRVELRAGLSYISVDQACRNLQREIASRTFEATKVEARSICNATYSKIRVKGGSARERRLFYTCLYRSCQFMKNITEDGQFRGPYDRVVHRADGHDFYIEDNLWDTYRVRHPLSILLEPERHLDVLISYVRMYEESGKMPQFPYMRGDLLYMNGNHAASMFLDACSKGFRDLDLAKAYQGLRKVATEQTVLPDTRGSATDLDRFYYQHGFYPALRPGEKETVKGVNPVMRRQSVSVTLDAAYDDWCISELAKMLDKSEDVALFSKRGQNYKNLFNHETGLFAPKDSSGEFIANFDPKWSGGQGGRDYFAECNGLVYNFAVQHDVQGLIELIGGRDEFIARLDALFSTGYNGELKFVFLARFPDSTGLIGQYPQGNEPSYHIPYLYCYAGAPWKTQKRVRQILQTWYSDQPLGLPGDDDNGAMSAWYVMSAMGFYPSCPGRPYYVIGSPLFEECEIDLPGGKQFRVIGQEVSTINKYIQSATLNGQSFDQPWLDHATLLRGGELALKMGPSPNKEWGAAPQAAPPEPRS